MILMPNCYAFIFRKTPELADLFADIRAHMRQFGELNNRPACASSWDEDEHLFANTCALGPAEMQQAITDNLDPRGLVRGRDYVVTSKIEGILDDSDWVRVSQAPGYIEYCRKDKSRSATMGMSATYVFLKLNQRLDSLALIKADPHASFHPEDLWDFRRCQMMLGLHPGLAVRLPEMADVSPQWAGIVEQWTALVQSYAEEVGDLYEAPTNAPKTLQLLTTAASKGLH